MSSVGSAPERWLRRLAKGAAVFLVVLGALVLAGWAFDVPVLKSLDPSFISMKPNTALVFVLLGVRLWLGAAEQAPRVRQIAVLVALVLVALTSLEDLAQIDLGIDELLFADSRGAPGIVHPGHMAPATQLGFLLLTTAALLSERRRGLWLAQILAMLAGVIGFVSLCAYLFGASALYAVLPAYNAIALHTAIGLLVAAGGLLAARPDGGLMTVLASATQAGRLLRRSQPAILLLPLLLGEAMLFLQTDQLVDPRFAVALLVSLGAVLLGILTWLIAAPFHREELARRRAEADAVANAERLALTLRSIADGIIETDLDGRVVGMNPVAEALTGWTLAEATGRPLGEVFRLVNEGTGAVLESPAVTALRDGPTAGGAEPTLVVARSGTRTPIVRSVPPIADPTARVVHGVVIVFSDATRERDADRFFALANDLLLVTGLDGFLKRMNPAAAAVFGYAEDELRGRPLIELIHPDDRTAAIAARTQLESVGVTPAPFEGRFRCKDGRYVWLSWTGTLDPPTGLKYVVARDITARRAIDEDKRLLAELAELMPTLGDAESIFAAIADKAGPHFEASRCFVSEIDLESGVSLIRRDYTHGVPSQVGTHDLRELGPDLLGAYKAGLPYVNGDSETDPRTRHLHASAFAPRQQVAGIGVPVLRAGRLLSCLVVTCATPRAWTEREVALLQTIAERAWFWVEHVRLVQALRESDALARLVAEGAKDQAIVMLDPSGHVATWNRGAARLHGFENAEILGQPLSVFHLPEDGLERRVREALGHAERTGQFEEEGWRLRKDGTRFWAHVTISALRDDAGVLRGFVKIIRDVSLRRQAKRDERWKATVLNSAFDAIVSIDHHGLILEWNPAAERLLGHARADVLGKPVTDVMIMPAEREAHAHGLARHLATGETRILGTNRELQALHADGTTRSIEMAVVRLEGHTPAIFTAFMRDISARKRFEGERQKLVDSLRELNADLETRVAARTAELRAMLAERDVLLREIHHRVKNNLQVISSLISMQMRQLPDDATRAALMDCQTRVTAIALVHHQLYRSTDFARIPFSDYARALARTIMAANVTAPERIQLEVATETLSLPIDKAIPCGLILNELMTNAGKYAFPGDRAGTIRVGLRSHGENHMRLTVADDGVGLPHAFDPDTATTLGLVLVQTLTEQLSGHLEFVGPPGTTVHVTFPPRFE